MFVELLYCTCIYIDPKEFQNYSKILVTLADYIFATCTHVHMYVPVLGPGIYMHYDVWPV